MEKPAEDCLGESPRNHVAVIITDLGDRGWGWRVPLFGIESGPGEAWPTQKQAHMKASEQTVTTLERVRSGVNAGGLTAPETARLLRALLESDHDALRALLLTAVPWRGPLPAWMKGRTFRGRVTVMSVLNALLGAVRGGQLFFQVEESQAGGPIRIVDILHGSEEDAARVFAAETRSAEARDRGEPIEPVRVMRLGRTSAGDAERIVPMDSIEYGDVGPDEVEPEGGVKGP